MKYQHKRQCEVIADLLSFVRAILEYWSESMSGTEMKFCSKKLFIAIQALELLHARPNFPKDFLPRQALFAHETRKLIWLEVLVLFMLNYLPAVRIYVDLSIGAEGPVRARIREQAFALNA